MKPIQTDTTAIPATRIPTGHLLLSILIVLRNRVVAHRTEGTEAMASTGAMAATVARESTAGKGGPEARAPTRPVVLAPP